MNNVNIEEFKYYNGFIIHQIEHRVRLLHDAELETFGITAQQSKIIAHLWLNKDYNIFQKDIEKAFKLKSSTITSILNTLQSKELINRISIDEDRRAKKIVLTEKGIDLHANIFKCLKNIENQLVKNMTDEQKIQLNQLLVKVYKNIEK